MLNTPYSQTIQASGGVAPFNWSVTGALPPNLAISNSATNSITIAGTPQTPAQAVAFTIKVTDSASQSATQSYTVSILAEPDTLTLSPASLSFAPQLMGTISAAQPETLTNTGTAAVFISSVALTGTNAADFSQNNTCASNLAAGANCFINVTFTPSQLGPRSASITITDSTLGSPHSVPLTGIGLTSGPNATLSATSLTFFNQAVGTTSSAQSLTLTNYGTTTLNVASVAVTGNFGETDTCSASSFGSELSCTINLTFTPGAAGGLIGTISVTDNAPGSPQTASLSGTGVHDILDGQCWSKNSINGICTGIADSAECPAGHPAISPMQVYLGCFFPHNSTLVDTSRPCSPRNGQGYCSVTQSTTNGASSATASQAPR